VRLSFTSQGVPTGSCEDALVTTAIRPAQEADLDGIARVGEITWPATYLTFAGADYVRHNLETYWSSSALQHALSDSLVFLVAVDDDEVTGVLEVGQFGSSPTMWRLYVMPARQGSGIGTALLHAAIDALPEGSTELVTEYTAGNDATGRWYELRGFTETHRDPRPQGLDVVWMRLALPLPERS